MIFMFYHIDMFIHIFKRLLEALVWFDTQWEEVLNISCILVPFERSLYLTEHSTLTDRTIKP